MARIRSIKPEMPQSESMGRISRDARLLFIQLWTLCDDEGRTRGNSRMLASLLYPYDDDAGKLIDIWMSELEREQCVKRYQAEGHAYLQVCNWQNHQKIDRPSKSKIPSPFEPDPAPIPVPVANAREPASNLREDSSEDQGRDQGEDQGRDRKGSRRPRESNAVSPTAPSDVDPQIWADWKAHRKTKKAAITSTVLKSIRDEAKNAGITFEDALVTQCKRNWVGFEASWLTEPSKKVNGTHSKQAELEQRNKQAGEEWLRRHEPNPNEPEIFDAIATERQG